MVEVVAVTVVVAVAVAVSVAVAVVAAVVIVVCGLRPRRRGRRGRGRSIDSDEDEHSNMMSVVQEIAHNRKEATRRQRIEAEQRRRDELRDGYARLKDVLPVSNQKSSKVSLLERGMYSLPLYMHLIHSLTIF